MFPRKSWNYQRPDWPGWLKLKKVIYEESPRKLLFISAWRAAASHSARACERNRVSKWAIRDSASSARLVSSFKWSWMRSRAFKFSFFDFKRYRPQACWKSKCNYRKTFQVLFSKKRLRKKFEIQMSDFKISDEIRSAFSDDQAVFNRNLKGVSGSWTVFWK